MPFDGPATLAALKASVGAKVEELCNAGCKEVAVRYCRSAKDSDKIVPPKPKDLTIPCSECVSK